MSGRKRHGLSEKHSLTLCTWLPCCHLRAIPGDQVAQGQPSMLAGERGAKGIDTLDSHIITLIDWSKFKLVFAMFFQESTTCLLLGKTWKDGRGAARWWKHGSHFSQWPKKTVLLICWGMLYGMRVAVRPTLDVYVERAPLYQTCVRLLLLWPLLTKVAQDYRIYSAVILDINIFCWKGWAAG